VQVLDLGLSGCVRFNCSRCCCCTPARHMSLQWCCVACCDQSRSAGCNRKRHLNIQLYNSSCEHACCAFASFRAQTHPGSAGDGVCLDDAAACTAAT
jgi:hypothetical protein